MRNHAAPARQQFIPLTDDEIEAIIAAGYAHLLRPYRVGSLCLPREEAAWPLRTATPAVLPEVA